ncbi:MAG: M28 family peptidase, partial [Longimicrobiales bacterium]
AAQLAAIARSRGPDRFFVDEVHDPIWQPELPVVLVGPAVLRALLGDARLPPGALEAGPIAPTPLGRTVSGHVAATVEDAPTTNVAGYIPGSDAALRDEFIAFTAHYDHLGIGAPDAGGDSIYNGFSDNAAGVAMLLAIAETMRAAPPDRSVLFLFFAAEERGLLGSTYYTTRPLVPLERTAAVINLDAGAPPAPPVSWRIAGDSIGLGPLARDVAASHGWTATLSGASPNTDYWPFLTRGVPAIFIVPGNEWEGVSAEGREVLRERWDHYHQPSDEWSAEFPFRGVARYADFALEVGRAAAQRSFAPPPIRK